MRAGKPAATRQTSAFCRMKVCARALGSLNGTTSLLDASLRVLCISLARPLHFRIALLMNGRLCISDVFEKQILLRYACFTRRTRSYHIVPLDQRFAYADGSLNGTTSLLDASLRVLCISLARPLHFRIALLMDGTLCISDVFEKQILPRCACFERSPRSYHLILLDQRFA